MNIVIVDDEPLAREGLRMMLAAHPDADVVGEAGNGRDAARLIAACQPDVALVDIQMPEMNGLELAMAIEPTRAPAFVFVTAYDQFALRAFDAQALDYVLKPVSAERLGLALERARERCRLRQAAVAIERFDATLQALRKAAPTVAPPTPPPSPERICVRAGDRRVTLTWAEVDWIESADYYVELHVGPKSYLHRESLAQLEPRLESAGFLRIHRCRMINRERIRELRFDGRRMSVVLDGDRELEVARRCHARLRAALSHGTKPHR